MHYNGSEPIVKQNISFGGWGTVQDRYTGDIGDFGKLGLLRWLSRTGLSIGVNWYRVPDEAHNSDGRHIRYLQKTDFRSCDEELWYALVRIVSSGRRKVAALEESDLLSAVFYSKVLDFSDTTSQERASIRRQWHTDAVDRFRQCDIVFADPDNGLIVPSAEGSAKSNKYALPFELADYFKAGSSVIYYQHKARRPDTYYIQQHRNLLASGSFPDASGLGIKFIKTSQRFYFFILHPGHKEQLADCIAQMLATPWRNCFEYLPAALF